MEPIKVVIAEPVTLTKLLTDNKVTASKSEARRLVMQGCVEVNGETVGADCTVGTADIKFKNKASELNIKVQLCEHSLAPAARVVGDNQGWNIEVWCADCGASGVATIKIIRWEKDSVADAAVAQPSRAPGSRREVVGANPSSGCMPSVTETIYFNDFSAHRAREGRDLTDDELDIICRFDKEPRTIAVWEELLSNLHWVQR